MSPSTSSNCIEQERDRYKKVLEKIVKYSHSFYAPLAKEALYNQGEEPKNMLEFNHSANQLCFEYMTQKQKP